MNSIPFLTSKTTLSSIALLNPCQHIIPYELAIKLFGKAENNQCENKRQGCPTCKVLVEKYLTAMTKIISFIEGNQQERFIKLTLSNTSGAYPGFEGTFSVINQTDRWESYEEESAFCSSGFIRLRSNENSSAIQRITLYKKDNITLLNDKKSVNNYTILLAISTKINFKNYLSNHKILCNSDPELIVKLHFYDDCNLYLIEDLLSIKTLFQLIISNNWISSAACSKMNNIIMNKH